MRRLDELIAFKVRPFESFRPVAMHNSIEHAIDTCEIGDRFKGGRILQQRKNAWEFSFQNRWKAVVDVKSNASLVSFLHQGGILLNGESAADSRIVNVRRLCGRCGDDF